MKKMKKIIARYYIQRAINFHLQMRASLLWARGYREILYIEHRDDHEDDLWHRAGCEYRAVLRLENLLKKYL